VTLLGKKGQMLHVGHPKEFSPLLLKEIVGFI
jgi:hypothetical protein